MYIYIQGWEVSEYGSDPDQLFATAGAWLTGRVQDADSGPGRGYKFPARNHDIFSKI